MAKIGVSNRDGVSTYTDATKWAIDAIGRLHIIRGSAEIASFHQEAWSSVEFLD